MAFSEYVDFKNLLPYNSSNRKKKLNSGLTRKLNWVGNICLIKIVVNSVVYYYFVYCEFLWDRRYIEICTFKFSRSELILIFYPIRISDWHYFMGNWMWEKRCSRSLCRCSQGIMLHWLCYQMWTRIWSRRLRKPIWSK